MANLPLHYGQAPRWLFSRMSGLAREIVYAIVKEHGADEFLNRISDPFWFQAFGCCLGFDWHSSGLTTTVCAALKAGLQDTGRELGLYFAGGKGATSRKTPEEIDRIGQARLIDVVPDKLIYASRMSAKVDNAALQDGYTLYQHMFIFTKQGKWSVVQQGMNRQSRYARRYHWLSETLNDFVCEPHHAVCCDQKHKTLNMVAQESQSCRRRSADLSALKPEKVLAGLNKLRLSSRHPVSLDDIRPENLKRILLKTYLRQPQDFEQLLGTPGVGPKTIRSLALISELIWGLSPSFRDPVRFSFAHGGKDGHPYPVNRSGYDRTIQILKQAVAEAKVGQVQKFKALQRLNKF
ncbi:DUF763 domain-containing protein [Candidatus Omnitrophota bacterium]